ncbi:MAG: methionine adenosyltransferase [Firmicutes bacterium]|nr:methionine adenosyltransferase [Bacillota bacterium]
MKKIITSESVNIGHPDKTCDFIADSFLDAALEQDPNAQMAVECAIKDDTLFIYGESTTSAKIDYDKIAREALKYIGYECEFKIIKKISQQSVEINRAVVDKAELGANDQGIVYGYATNEGAEYMPLSIIIAHKLMKKYDQWRRTRKDFFADAKSQVSVEYDGNVPVSVHTVLVSASHAVGLTNEDIWALVRENVVLPILGEYKLDISRMRLIINPSGAFTIWGSFSDSGCVGRKIVVDTYGGVGRVGGGCFSSKNATKVDRSGAYYARYVAKNIVAHKMADQCEVGVSYAIGLTEPLKVNIETFGTEKININRIYDWVSENFDFSPSNMIKELDLLEPIYKETACYGHFGRDGFPWEKIKK